jgi:sugar lactone lactonase YvrE
MGRVFLARSAGGRPVAVKVIRPDLAADGEFRARFQHEVAAARKVNGLYTALVVDADVDGPVPWLATAYVAGPSLADKVRLQGPLPAEAVAVLAAGLAEGLGAIHAAGLVHRDLKPSNVLLADDGPRVIDFGISRAAEASALTSTGLVVGSPGFMSPEQASGGDVGPPSDVFSLGAVLTFACTGHGPFGTGSAPALGYRVVHAEPDLADVPPQLRSLVGRCLAKDPAGRPTVAELLAEFGDPDVPEDWLSPSASASAPTWTPTMEAGPGPAVEPPDDKEALASSAAVAAEDAGPAPVPAQEATQANQPGPALEVTESRIAGVPPAPAAATAPGRHAPAARPPKAVVRPRTRVLLAVGLPVVAGVCVLVAFLASRPSTAQPPAAPSSHTPPSADAKPSHQAAPPAPKPVADFTDPGGTRVTSVAFSPQGTMATSDANGSTYLWNLTTRTRAATLVGPGGVPEQSVAFSPDGTTLAAGADGSTYLWNLSTRKVTATLVDPSSYVYTVESVAFSPDGTMLAAGDDNGGTYLWNLSSRKVIATRSESNLVESVAFSPHGNAMAVGDSAGAYLWNLSTDTTTAALTDVEAGQVDAVAFSPTGTVLAVSDSDGSTYLWNLSTDATTATLTDPGAAQATSVAFSPDGHTLAVGDTNGSAYLWNLSSNTVAATYTGPKGAQVTSVAFSPSGTTLAAGDSYGSTYVWKLPAQAS